MQFFQLDLESKKIIDEFFFSQRINAGDMLFGNLYIWHFSRKIEYCILHDCLIIKTTYPDSAPFLFFPLGRGDRARAILDFREYFLDNNLEFCFKSLEIEQKNELEKIFENKLIARPNRDRFDYVYSVSELINLEGRKFHNKKNHFNRFLNNYPNFVYENIDSSNASEVLATYEKWFKANLNPSEGIKNEFIGIKNALLNFQTLDFRGGLLRIEGNIAAFSFGERLNENTALIHIEKANIFYTGIYQAINQQFLTHAWSEMEFVNREEDLGIEGLRRAKMTYNPAFFVEKFEANLI